MDDFKNITPNSPTGADAKPSGSATEKGGPVTVEFQLNADRRYNYFTEYFVITASQGNTVRLYRATSDEIRAALLTVVQRLDSDVQVRILPPTLWARDNCGISGGVAWNVDISAGSLRTLLSAQEEHRFLKSASDAVEQGVGGWGYYSSVQLSFTF
jgi:hypothetical protein